MTETELPAVLEGATLADLMDLDLGGFTGTVVDQLSTPRQNLGGTGPPGRTD